MRRGFALLLLVVLAAGNVPAAPKDCAMPCAKTAACCCAKRSRETDQTRLTVTSDRCCKGVGLNLAGGAARVPSADDAVDLPSDVASSELTTLPVPSTATPRTGGPRAPPSSFAV